MNPDPAPGSPNRSALPGPQPAAVALARTLVFAVLLASEAKAFEIDSRIANPQDFSGAQLSILQTAVAEAESLWESVVTGYQEGITLPGISVAVRGNTSGFAAALIGRTEQQAGFRVATEGTIWINFDVIDELSDYEGSGVNVIDEIIAHEIGHVLGIGSLWVANDVYRFGSGRYTGAHGLAAYRREFDAAASFVPVELAGAPGTANNHWDQRMRSSTQEGDPSDPFSLSPLLGITDRQGRDLALELMTGAIDPDFGEPFLSPLSVQSLRDLGFTVVPEPATGLLLAVVFMAGSTAGRGRATRGLS